jgi:hypothetical protein
MRFLFSLLWLEWMGRGWDSFVEKRGVGVFLFVGCCLYGTKNA